MTNDNNAIYIIDMCLAQLSVCKIQISLEEIYNGIESYNPEISDRDLSDFALIMLSDYIYFNLY